MATPKSLRQPPPRNATKYILTRHKDDNGGLLPILDNNMKLLSGGYDSIASQDLAFNGSNAINVGNSTDAISTLTPLGFNFEFDGVTYDKFIGCVNGWMLLVEPTQTSPYNAYIGVLDSIPDSFANTEVFVDNVTNSTLLCPWFDDLLTITNDITLAQPTLTTTQINSIKNGFSAQPSSYNEIRWGVRYYYDFKSHEGRRTIVRWNTLSDAGNPGMGSLLRFEVVIYENGKIEFRYPSRKELNIFPAVTPANESATVGIFPPGNRRFRDFSNVLGQTDSVNVPEYEFGGATWSSDTIHASRAYVHTLRPYRNWPGFATSGAVFSFQPPQLSRKILPRATLKIKDSEKFISKYKSYDDQRALTFNTSSSTTKTLVGYPTTLPRFVGGDDISVTQRQNLFGNNLFVSSSISKFGIDDFIETKEIQTVFSHNAFSEDNRFELNIDTSDAFFVSGTIPQLSQPTKSKSQIKLSLPINFTTTMLNTTSSMLYYNAKFGRWEFPENAVQDLVDPVTYNLDPGFLLRYQEDYRGFGPIGNQIASGSLVNLTSQGSNTISSLSREMTINNVRRSLIETFDPEDTFSTHIRYSSFNKTATRNSDYDANRNQTFQLNFDKPFVIEKAIIELPIECGPGWFADVTKTFVPMRDTDAYVPIDQVTPDFSGPALTLALYNQLNIGNTKVRDLIMTGTITHEFDNKSELVMSSFPPLSSTFVIRPEGFLAYASAPGAIINAQNVNATNQFTGSIAVQAEALISNGPTILLQKSVLNKDNTNFVTDEEATIEINNLINSPFITLTEQNENIKYAGWTLTQNIAYANPVGRGLAGELNPSGRSVFGNEFGTFQGTNIFEKGKFPNPFYLTPQQQLSGTQYYSVLNAIQDEVFLSGAGEGWKAAAMLPLSSHFRSPYLVLPGDNLVLSISKTRPSLYRVVEDTLYTSGNISHDIKLIPGNINITLYGSFLQEGSEVSDMKNQFFNSDAIHSIYGDEPILDQYDVPYIQQYIGGMCDDYIMGSMVTKTKNAAQQTIITTTGNMISGGRGRVFSSYSARNQPNPSTNSKSFNAQPWWEKVGTPRVSQFIDNSERYWDSFMPGISDIMKTDDVGILTIPSGSTSLGPPSTMITDANLGLGLIIFDVLSSAGNVNNDWSKAYPFEPKYSSLARQKNIEKSLIATLTLIGLGVSSSVAPISPKPLNSVYVMQGSLQTSIYPSYADRAAGLTSALSLRILSDVDLSQTPSTPSYFQTGSANFTDISKYMFGFGDMNTTGYDINNEIIAGTNHAPDSKIVSAGNTPFDRFFYLNQPVIRGWKYGAISGLPTYSKAYFRKNHYGQFRDMLEPRPFTRYYKLNDGIDDNIAEGLLAGPIQVKFVDINGNITNPENTQASNLDLFATSSCPYVDGIASNRPPLIQETLNSNIINLSANEFGITNL